MRGPLVNEAIGLGFKLPVSPLRIYVEPNPKLKGTYSAYSYYGNSIHQDLAEALSTIKGAQSRSELNNARRHQVSKAYNLSRLRRLSNTIISDSPCFCRQAKILMGIFDSSTKYQYHQFMVLKRYVTSQIRSDLKRKMVFLGGPRQVGKTFLCTHLERPGNFDYFNWDIENDRTLILERELGRSPLLVLDEIHKYRRWRGLLKSLYDAGSVRPKEKRAILVTGSGRLDLYRYGGDSLQGRYHFIRLLPLTLGELKTHSQNDLISLMRYSGFPEPFLRQSEAETMRWSREYSARIVRDDIRDLETIQDLATCELLLRRLPEVVGSPLSINALREDLQVAHRTVQKWIHIYERLFAVFRISPTGGPKIRAVKKEPKLYFFNWTLIHDESFRFENLIGVHLLKYSYWLQDSKGLDAELRYFRDTDGREVDFVLTIEKNPPLFVECKLSDAAVSPSLRYLRAKYPTARACQLSLHGKKNYVTPDGIHIAPAAGFLPEWG